MRTILVTGSTGFTGSHVLDSLSGQHDLELIAACRDKSRLPAIFKGSIREGDLRDNRYLATVLDGVDTVCHCAAWTSLFGHASESRELYFEPTIQFINAARESGVRRFINVSTTSAAAPDASADANSAGIARAYWPHLCNVVAIEDHLRRQAGESFNVINLRLGLFAGSRYALGLLPILLPRLKTHLVPWVAGGSTSMPIIDGRDIGQAFLKSVLAENMAGYQSFNIVGPAVPTVREVIHFLHSEYGFPEPHFSVPFPLAFAFAGFMELLDPLVPWDPLVTRSIVHLLREVNASNDMAASKLSYRPEYDWRVAIRTQLDEMSVRQTQPMRMTVPRG